MNRIKFLGTAGARFVVAKQLRASGGIWLTIKKTNLLIDPGPGSLVKCASSKPKLDPLELDGIILTHRHLDHSADINAMIEAMTSGGFNKKGVVFAPEDALSNDPVILKYVRDYVERVEILKEGGRYEIGDVSFGTPKKHLHSVETYGLNIEKPSISLISDTRYFDKLERYYRGDVIIINVVRLKPMEGLDHLCLADAEKIIDSLKPKLSILTHFGMSMLKAKPWELAAEMEKKLGVKIIAARDGMNIDLDNI